MILEGPSDTVHAEVGNGVGRLILDRPQALNALDLTMIRTLRDSLEAWREDSAVSWVLIESSSSRAFCAGGDIRGVRAAVLAGETASAEVFFAQEYALNRCIAEYPKPYVSLIDGVCMGGGLGISVHGSHRIVTERATLAMPEVAIGFVPDIGSSYFLPRLPGRLGRYLALTGSRLGADAAVAVGLATHRVDSGALAQLRADLLDGRELDPLLAGLDDTTAAGELDQAGVDAAFAAPDLAAVDRNLAGIDAAWAVEARLALASASPLSLAVTDELLKTGQGLPLAECLDRELAVVRRLIRTPDFAEGVRARLVDKDARPIWIRGAELADETATLLNLLRDADSDGGSGLRRGRTTTTAPS